MDLVKDISKSLNFKERYDDLERTGMEEYDRKECKELRELEKSVAPLSQSQKDTLHYCNTIRGERGRLATQTAVSAGKVVAGLYTGNTALAMQGVTDFGGYVMDEAAEVQGPNDGVGQHLGIEDAHHFGMQDQIIEMHKNAYAGTQTGATAARRAAEPARKAGFEKSKSMADMLLREKGVYASKESTLSESQQKEYHDKLTHAQEHKRDHVEKKLLKG